MKLNIDSQEKEISYLQWKLKDANLQKMAIQETLKLNETKNEMNRISKENTRLKIQVKTSCKTVSILFKDLFTI
jgi:hypothetical protein